MEEMVAEAWEVVCLAAKSVEDGWVALMETVAQTEESMVVVHLAEELVEEEMVAAVKGLVDCLVGDETAEEVTEEEV